MRPPSVGVAEKLYALLPLLKDLGLDLDWWVLKGGCDFSR